MGGLVPRGNCKLSSHYEFMVHVSLPPGGILGLRGSAHAQGLEVEEVRAGGILNEKWNRGAALCFARDVVRKGDIIISANGRADSVGILNALRRAPSARLRIV